MNSKTIVAAIAVTALLTVPLVASAQSDSPPVPGGVFHGRWADQMDAQHDMMFGMDHDTMMSDIDHDTMMSDIDHNTMMSDIDHNTMMSDIDHNTMMSDIDHNTMMSGDGMGAMDPGGMSPGGMTAAGPAGHDGHHGSDSTQSESP